MTTNSDLWAADQMAYEFTIADQALQNEIMLALAEYDLAPSYEAWLLSGDAVDNEDTEKSYGELHALYIRLWHKLGSEMFFVRLEAAKREVLILQAHKRKGWFG